jgi:hypothetical protein
VPFTVTAIVRVALTLACPFRHNALVRLEQRAARQHRRQLLAVRRRRVDVLDRLELAQRLANLAQSAVSDLLADERALHLAARTGAGPMPPSVTAARVTLPLLSSSISTAAETMAKSPCRRANSTKA